MTRSSLLSICLLACLAVPASAEKKPKVRPPPASPQQMPGADDDFGVVPPTSVPVGLTAPDDSQPWPLRLMIHPLKKGMLIRLPIMDTDPNRGLTYGFMPIWVFTAPGSDRIEQIHAPSISYNKTFKAIPTYRLYYYPTEFSELILRASVSLITDREVLGEYYDHKFLGTEFLFGLKVQYNIDGAKRFYGQGPDTPKTAESNYIEDIIQYNAVVGYPLQKRSPWLVSFTNRFQGYKISDGPINALPDISAKFPGVAPYHRHQNGAIRLGLEYNTRDHDVTTSKGGYAGFFAESAQLPFGSEYDYERWLVDLRKFHPWTGTKNRQVTAAMLKFDQLDGSAPFWLMPQLGGKYIHRAYGEGRYIDKGMLTTQLEHRYSFFQVEMAGVSTEFEVAPFAGLGIVFEEPRRMVRRYARPVYGAAIRAVARPQVVGSIDFGVGQEGLTAFMDINYSF